MNRTVIWLHVFYYKFSFPVQYRFTFNLLNTNTNNSFYINMSFKIINIVAIVSLQWSSSHEIFEDVGVPHRDNTSLSTST